MASTTVNSWANADQQLDPNGTPAPAATGTWANADAKLSANVGPQVTANQSTLGDIGTGASQGASDIWNTVKGTVAAVEPPAMRGDFSQGAASILPPAYTKAVGGAVQGIKDLPLEYHAYEQARQRGASPVDAATQATGVKAAKDQVVAKVKQGIKDFEANPTQETTRALVDAAGLVASMWGPDALSAAKGAEGATEAEAASEPSLVQKVMKGKTVSQGPATQAVGKTAAKVSESAGVGAPGENAVNSFGDAGDNVLAKAKAQYQALDDATGGRVQRFQDRLKNIHDQLSDLTGTEEDVAKEAKLLKAQKETQDAMNEAFDDAKAKGIDPATVDKAKADYKQGNALQDLDAQVFQSRIAEKTDATGQSNLVDPSKLLPRMQKMYKSGRLQEAVGEENAIDLLKQTKDFVVQGNKAVRVQQLAKWAARIIGGAGTVEAAHEIMGSTTN